MPALSDDDDSDDTEYNDYKFKVSAFVCPEMHTKKDKHQRPHGYMVFV